MAAPTNTYVDYANGNDYKGASFIDGAYTSATKTLVKAGAFAASQVNHWLFLESNDGGSIVAGYYKIATVSDANTVILATDAGAGVDDDAAKCTQHDGTTNLPWRSIQGALDLITRDATNGDQINVKAGTAQVNQAALTLARYGTPTAAIPLIIRGYTTVAGDGGIGEIDANGVILLAAASTMMFVDLKMHNFGNNNGITGGAYCCFYRCEVYKGASTPSSKRLLNLGNFSWIVGCHIRDAGTTGTGIVIDSYGQIYNNYIKDCPTGITCYTGTAIVNNIIVNSTVKGIAGSSSNLIVHNSVYVSSASTGTGIEISQPVGVVLNNIIEGYGGAGGDGIYTTSDVQLIGYNALYNNTTNLTTGDRYIDLTANDIALASSPFVAAATGNFALNTAVAGAIDGAYPGAWPGLATTTDHADIGAVQNGAGSGGGGRPAFGDRSGGKQ